MLPPPLRRLEHQFDLGGVERVSTRGVNRATGRSEGVWFAFNSTNVNKAKVDPQYDLDGNKTGVGTITIEFVSGAMYEFEDRPMSDWYDIISSSSKGRHAYYVVRGAGPSVKGKSLWQPFKQIREAWRSRDQIKAIIAAREPRGKHKHRLFTVGGRTNKYGAGGARIT